MNEEQSPGRLIAFLAVSMVILMVWQSLFPAPMPEVPVPADPVTERIQDEEKLSSDSPNRAPLDSDAGVSERIKVDTVSPVAKQPERRIDLESDLLQVQLSSHGARLTGATFRNFREPGTDPKRPLIELVPEDSVGFGTLEAQGLDIDADYKVVQQDRSSVTFQRQFADGSLLQRRWKLEQQSLRHELVIQDNRSGERTFTFGLEMGNPAESGGGFLFGTLPDLARGLCRAQEDLLAQPIAEIADAEEIDLKTSSAQWAGVDRNYFGAFLLPGESGACEIRRNLVNSDTDQDALTGRVQVRFTRAMKWSGGSKSTWDAQVLIVPKSEGLLKATHPTLIDTIDFGIFKFLAAPMLWLLNWLFGVVGNYGIAIVLLTLIVKTLLFPITDMSYRSMAKMKEIQPELTKLRAKYESDRQMQAQKQMELFKEKGVNPAGGCLPMLLQIPVWFALYSTLRVAVELYGAPFIPGWIDDLTLSDPIYVMPLLLGVLFFFQQKLQPTPSDNPSQQMVMKIMPVMMTVFMIALPAGLVLYILFNTILGIAHQYYAIKRDQKSVAEAAA
tara:strand:+ start:1059 stop:2732 length:1674 start_codon:yes stop_codon:yes gene_type:complete